MTTIRLLSCVLFLTLSFTSAPASQQQKLSINGIELGDSTESAVKILSYSKNPPKFQTFYSYKTYRGFELPKALCGVEASIVAHSEIEKFELATELEKPHRIIAIRRMITFNWQEGITPTIDKITKSLTDKYGTPQIQNTKDGVITLVWQKNNTQKLDTETSLQTLSSQIMSTHIGDYKYNITGKYDQAGTVLIAFITPSIGMPHYPADSVFPKQLEYILYDTNKVKKINESFLDKLREGYNQRVRDQQDMGDKLFFMP
ncbi:MAG TPA: hypothetical protein PKC79_01650 [Solidesulfovibrio magneticus]|nr:hypothetical protein [Solidesulfovibrio magneticus]